MGPGIAIPQVREQLYDGRPSNYTLVLFIKNVSRKDHISPRGFLFRKFSGSQKGYSSYKADILALGKMHHSNGERISKATFIPMGKERD